jgi:Icc-related predicted phosphoesterase
MVRIAACADVHFGTESAGTLRPDLEHLTERADVFLLAGDLTRSGAAAEADVLAAELDGLPIPVVAVLGNHDFHAGQEGEVRRSLEEVGIVVLEGETAVVDVGDMTVGVAGIKGFGGGFAGACATEFGEPEMKAFVRHTRHAAVALEACLNALETDLRVALLHYSPVPETLRGERLEIFPFLGSYLLAEAADRAGADIMFHGHAHGGSEKGVTPGGIPVRNVSQPVIRRAYALYTLEADRARRPVAI